MATLTIRQLDDAVYERLKIRARENHRSVEAEVRVILDERSRHSEAVDRLRAFHDRMVAKHGYLSDSVDVIRQVRDEA